FLTYNAGGVLNAATGLMGTTTIRVPGANWQPNEWVGQTVHISSGWDTNDYQTVLSNTSDTITVDHWATPPDPNPVNFEILVPPAAPAGRPADLPAAPDLPAEVHRLHHLRPGRALARLAVQRPDPGGPGLGVAQLPHPGDAQPQHLHARLRRHRRLRPRGLR